MARRLDITQKSEKTPPVFDCEPKFDQQKELSKDLTWSDKSAQRVR
jgi:hypothetical protein